MSEFGRKIMQGIYDNEWTGKVTGFRSYSGVREYPIQPDDQNVHPERGKTVTVFTEEGLAAHDRETAAKALEEHAWEAYEAYLIDPDLDWPSQPSQSAMHFKSSADKLRRRAQEYRSGETDN